MPSAVPGYASWTVAVMPARRSASAVTGPAMPPPMTIAVRTVVMLVSLGSFGPCACGTDLGGSPAILVVAASGRTPSQVWYRGQGPGGVLAHPAGAVPSSGMVDSGVLVLFASSVSSAGISPVSWKARQVSSPG